jgi:peptide/nickel transport system substrate-binding protein
LIVDNHVGIFPDPTNWNWLVPGVTSPGKSGGPGANQLCNAWLWYLNTTNNEIINWLASGPPIYSPDLKELRIYVRKGVYWNDGVPFTADDIVFTIKYLKEAPPGIGVVVKTWVEDVYKEDDYTAVIKLKGPNPRFHYQFLVIIYSAPIAILPKHVWEGKDPMTFKFYPPVCIGPYNLKAVDSGGAWFLWERYDDWWGTKLFGMKPSPKYVLYIYYGPEETMALAMIKHACNETESILWKFFHKTSNGRCIPYLCKKFNI